METEKIISDVINMPAKYNELGNITYYSLLRNAGYFEVHDQINEDKILEQLIKHPEWVKQWIQYSEDKRTASGWYFLQDTDGKYIVEYYPPQQKFKTLKFFDIKEACAVFIKIEIERERTLYAPPG